MENLIKNTRSTRSFNKDIKVTRKELENIIETLRFTPNANNSQELRYLLVTKEDEVEKVNSLTKWAALIKDRILPPKGKEPASYIIICSNDSIRTSDSFINGVNVGIVCEAIMLILSEMSLSGCIIASIDRNKIRDLFNLDEKIVPQIAIAIGKGDENIKTIDSSKDVKYYRDKENTHIVPKLIKEKLIIN